MTRALILCSAFAATAIAACGNASTGSNLPGDASTSGWSDGSSGGSGSGASSSSAWAASSSSAGGANVDPPDTPTPGDSYGAILSPRNAALVEGDTTAPIAMWGYHSTAGETIQVQALLDPSELTTWTTIATATADTTPDPTISNEQVYRWKATVTPDKTHFPPGGFYRLRAIDAEGQKLFTFDDDADACLAANATSTLKDQVSACGSAFPRKLVLVSPSPSPSDALLFGPLYLDDKGFDFEDETFAYYDLIGAPDTLFGFRSAFGFDDNDEVVATYYNAGDLGIGREMHCVQNSNGIIACYVSNYGVFDFGPDIALPEAVEGALSGDHDGAFATVAMVYTPPIDAPNAVTFMVYDANDDLSATAQLDAHGDNESVPNNCLNCHGLRSKIDLTQEAQGPRFLPFDLGSLEFADLDGFRRADQEESIRKLNQMVLAAAPTESIEKVVKGWYASSGGIDQPGAVADTNYVQKGWDLGPADKKVYANVVKPYCRSCHASSTLQPGVEDPLEYTSGPLFASDAASFVQPICGTQGVASSHTMPNAEQPLTRFWKSNARGWLASYLNLPGPCAP